MHIHWKYIKESIKEQRVMEVEKRIGVAFPSDFKKIVMTYHGARTEEDEIEVDGVDRVFGGLLSFDEESLEFIVAHCEGYKEIVDKGYVPFARDPGGNNFCFDFSKEESKIVFWNHETDTFYKISDTFTDFLTLLHE